MTEQHADRVKTLARVIVATVTAVATFYFVFWVGAAFLPLSAPIGSAVRVVVAAMLALLTVRYLLRAPASRPGLMRAITMSALVTGAVGFVTGFFGPMVFSPGSNQGPLLGFFLGPIGFIAGGIGGAIHHYWSTPARRRLQWSLVVVAVLAVIVLARVVVTKAPSATRDFRQAGPREVATGDSAMVVSASPLASRVGVRLLLAGGNAVDAAVGVAFTLAVTYPTAGNIGGGGLMLARVRGETVALDFREVAPLAATRDMYLDATGNPTDRSVTGALAVGVPGSVAGLWAAHQKFGVLPWRDVVQPAIALADTGFVTDAAFVEDQVTEGARFARFPATAALFRPNGWHIERGARWKNPDLASTLRLIAQHGTKGFYEGETAKKIVAEMTRDGGIISLEDLRRYAAKWRTPVEFTYRGYRVLTMPPVSSGGLTFALIANILGGYDLHAMGWHSTDAIHVMAEAERIAYARRNTLLADPDFVPVPVASFLSPDTAAALRHTISMTTHKLAPVAPDPVRGRHTTHFSVVDAEGNAVALTTTLNTGYGSAVTVTGAGFLLNNEMDDFTAKPGALNAMGLRQGEANAIVPGKRMLSSMMPTIVLDSAGSTFLVVGAAGGARIITAVAQIVSNVIDFGMPIGAAMRAPRFHAQDFPDRIEMQSDDSGGMAVIPALKKRGHQVLLPGDIWAFGWAQGILRSKGHWQAATEPRGNGLAAGY